MLDYSQLDALSAVLRTGSFEAASAQLGVTQSAVSQRIKQLEEKVGSVLVSRGQPCTATPAGAQLANHADTVRLMERHLTRHLQPGAAPLRLAVNADSMATWMLPALASQTDFLYDLVIDDQDHSTNMLRSGDVVAAVTSHAKPIQGCDSHPLGSLRYVATASPAFMARHFPQGVTAETLAKAPALTFNPKDRLQTDWARAQTGTKLTLPTHHFASSEGFVQAAVLGLGWGMNPEVLVRDQLANGELVALVPDAPMDVAHYWQISRLASEPLAGLTRAILAAARAALIQSGTAQRP